MTTTSPLEAVLKRDRAIVIGGLVGVIALAWIYILLGAGMGMTATEMTAGSGSSSDMQALDMALAAMQPVAWSVGYAVLMFFMWWIMMVAMMLPSAAPMILLYAAVNRKAHERGAPFVPTGVFAVGYLATWGVFSLLAVTLQWGLERTALLSSMMASTSLVLGGLLLIAAGAWQLTPLKHACLKHCRSPLHFLSHHWRKGRGGAFRMGVEHGAFCLGCCWFLMGLLFYGGVMNLYWIVGLAAYVLLEKTVPAGHWLGSAAGVGLIAWGGVLLIVSL
jgi:predicted metal-binding membrane protein